MIVPIGHANFIQTEKVVAVLSMSSLQGRRLRDMAEKSGVLINATSGRMARSIILLTSNHMVLSSLQPEAIKRRFRAFTKAVNKAGEEYH